MPQEEEKSIRFPLRTIYFYPTESCNLKCIHCWLQPSFAPDDKTYEQQNRENIDPALMEDVVRDAIPLGLQSIKLTGGEPFLNPGIFDYMECFRKHGLVLSFETNGTLLLPETVERLKEFQIGQISISLDGSTPSIHERIRGIKGSFEKALRGIELLIKSGFYPQVIFCLQRLNAHDLEDCIKLAESLGVRSFEINPLILQGEVKPRSEQCKGLSLEELISIEKKVEDSLYSRSDQMSIDLYLPPSFKGMKELSRNGFSTCRIHNICGLLSNGDVSICGIGSRKRDYVMGNVRKKSIAKIWKEGAIFNEIRKRIPFELKGICGRCFFKYHCMGFCRADVMTDITSLADPLAMCDELYEKGLFPETRLFTDIEISRIKEARVG